MANRATRFTRHRNVRGNKLSIDVQCERVKRERERAELPCNSSLLVSLCDRSLGINDYSMSYFYE